MPADYILLALLWTSYCTVHSALISITISGYFSRTLGYGYRFYRLFFNLFSLFTLIPLILYSHSPRFQTEPFFRWSGYWRILQYSMIALAAVLIAGGARRYSMRRFLGIQQLCSGKSSGMMANEVHFARTGVFGLVRHPWYLAVFILLWTVDLNAAAITINLVLSAYLIIGTFLEEKKILLEFGSRYKDYQNQVSMFFPFKWLRSRYRR